MISLYFYLLFVLLSFFGGGIAAFLFSELLAYLYGFDGDGVLIGLYVTFSFIIMSLLFAMI